MDEAMSDPAVRVVVDDRESRAGLADVLRRAGLAIEIARLPVGDVAIGARILVERKTTADFAASIADRRLFDQAYALRGACSRPLIVIEGDDAAAFGRISVENARGALTALVVSYGIPVLRTQSLDDTAVWIGLIVARETQRLERLARAAKRRAEPRTSLDVLCAIPGVGPRRASSLVEHLGSPRAVFNAEQRTLRDVPGVGPVVARRIEDAADGSGRVAEAVVGCPRGAPSWGRNSS
jgi:Fanconi anemia group M protein